jgi:hypothetical protein
MRKRTYDLLSSYRTIKEYVVSSGFQQEIQWQTAMDFDSITERDFLRESAWVILCTGISEKVVRKHFRNISFCFLEWESAYRIVEMKEHCIEYATTYFNNHRKIPAIADVAEKIVDTGFIKLKKMVLEAPIETLKSLNFIGEITAYHLAKNLGLPFAKDDRHLSRLSNFLGYNNAQDLCGSIAKSSGDPIQVVDIILWRFATLTRGYVDIFENLVLSN